MHCGNIVLLEGKPTLFDAIEFSEKIATIDVLYDLAFLLMDLGRRGERRVANLVLNRYLHLRRAEEDLSGLAALPLFLATRAGVRALVTADLVHELEADASAKQRKDALEYFRASMAWLKPVQPRLICVGGLSGSGKSTLAARLAHDIGLAPGALHVRSDVERKVLAGVDETVHLPPESYSAAASEATYRAIFQRAKAALKAGHSVILDAVFAREERTQRRRKNWPEVPMRALPAFGLRQRLPFSSRASPGAKAMPRMRMPPSSKNSSAISQVKSAGRRWMSREASPHPKPSSDKFCSCDRPAQHEAVADELQGRDIRI